MKANRRIGPFETTAATTPKATTAHNQMKTLFKVMVTSPLLTNNSFHLKYVMDTRKFQILEDFPEK
jgi:hypothetical protein